MGIERFLLRRSTSNLTNFLILHKLTLKTVHHFVSIDQEKMDRIFYKTSVSSLKVIDIFQTTSILYQVQVRVDIFSL